MALEIFNQLPISEVKQLGRKILGSLEFLAGWGCFVLTTLWMGGLMMILVGVSATLSCRPKSQMFLIVNILKDFVTQSIQSIGHRRRFGNNELDFEDQQKIIHFLPSFI